MPRALPPAALLLATALAARPGGAQATDSAGACLPAPTADSLDVVVAARVAPFDSAQRVPPIYTELLADAIAARLRPPTPLALRVYESYDVVRDRPKAGQFGYLALGGMYALTVRRPSARPATRAASAASAPSAAAVTSSLNDAFDARAVAALTAAAADSELPPLFDEMRADTVAFRVFVTTSHSGFRAGARPLFRMRVPRVRIASHVRLLPPARGQPRTPEYPYRLRMANVEGDVLVRFVVAPDGTVEPRSLGVVRATDRAFVEAVGRHFGGRRFTPARVDGCAVAAAVVLPYQFRLRYD